MESVRVSKAGLAIGAGLLALAGGIAWLRFHGPKPAQPTPRVYADAQTCVACHADIAAKYRKTGMGRSFYRLTASTTVEKFGGKPFYHALSGSYFAMTERGGKYFQRRWQTGFDGKETNIDDKQVDFVVGSGNHVRTYLHLTARNTLQVLPLSWYSEKGGYWAMSPGYDHPDYPGSVRPIHYECIFCHNAYPKLPAAPDGAEMTFATPLPEGIDCQRCHGPGQKHVDLASTGAPVDQLKAAIVNPKRLSADREMEVCLQCHLETTSRSLPHAIRVLDRAPFTYDAGQPLGDYRLDFDAPQGNQSFDIAHAGYRLRKSQCYLKSGDKLRCTTCHDAHDVPRGEAAMVQYNAKCATCHAAGSVKVEASTHKTGADCVSCHMPKRRTDDVVHVVMTDHYIQRRKPAGDLLVEKTEAPESEETGYRGEVVPYYPAPSSEPRRELIVAIAQVQDRANLTAGLPKLAALVKQERPENAAYYAELAQGYRFSGDLIQAIENYREAARRDRSAYRLAQLGNALMEARQFPEAERTLRDATGLDPNEPVAWATLGWVLWQENKGADAQSALERAVQLDPELPESHNNLGAVLWGAGQQDAALREYREALRIQPGVADWRVNLARVLASRGETAEAAHQAAAAARLNPKSAEAHEISGALMISQGNPGGGIAELETAVRLEPGFGRAHYELGIALGQRGDTSRAVDHLRAALAGRDPEAAAAARQVLQTLRQ